jgi:hypothetical protein
MNSEQDNTLDNDGTTQEDGREMLRSLRDDVFGGDMPKTALALGRSEEELENMLAGDMLMDDDLAMKIRGISQQRSNESSAGKAA